MTKISKPQRFSKLFMTCLFMGFLGACADSQMTKESSSQGMVLTKDSPHIIGGAPVKESEEYAEKILYLATGVKMQNSPTAGAKVNWSGSCTASAISRRVILTAAHCVEGLKPDQLSVVLTKDPVVTPLKISDWYSVKVFRAHERYGGQANGYENDLALILLNRDLPQSRVLQLAEPNQVELPMEFMAVGYGTTSDSSDPNMVSKKTALMNFVMKTVEDFDVNQKTFSINQNDHKGFCSGDSGGPGLVYDPETHEYWILGVVSNVSMKDAQRKTIDPQNKYSLCIGQGNYVNVLNPELRNWIEVTYLEIMKGA